MTSTTNAVILTVKGEVRNCKLPVGSAANSILTEAQLMGVLKRKTEPEEICAFKYEAWKLTFFGYSEGRAGTESKHSLPPPHAEETYYGDILVVASKKGSANGWSRPVAFTTKDYEEFYQHRLMNDGEEGADDESEDDSYSESGEKESVDEVVEAEADGEAVEEEEVVEEEVDEEEEEEESEDEELEEEGEEGGDDDEIGGGGGDDEDEIVISKTRGKKKAPPKPTNAAANTGRGKQSYLLQKGTITDAADAIHSGPQHAQLLQILRTRCAEPYIQAHAEEIAAVIEDSACAEAERRGIVRHHANPLFEAVYKAVVRRIIGNLDPASYVGNTHLHTQLVSGDLTLDTLRSMTTQDMNPALYKELYDRQLLREQAQLEGNKAMTTEMFKCSRCKKNQCTYYQLQTRSADEPMTTFISCLNCGKRWKE